MLWALQSADTSEFLAGSIELSEVLFVKKKGLYSFSVHVYPILNQNNAVDTFKRRDSVDLVIQCETTDQRESWVAELKLLVTYPMEPIHGLSSCALVASLTTCKRG